VYNLIETNQIVADESLRAFYDAQLETSGVGTKTKPENKRNQGCFIVVTFKESFVNGKNKSVPHNAVGTDLYTTYGAALAFCRKNISLPGEACAFKHWYKIPQGPYCSLSRDKAFVLKFPKPHYGGIARKIAEDNFEIFSLNTNLTYVLLDKLSQ
jgi:hypothetical protein